MTPVIPSFENSASATLNFAFKSPDRSSSISAFVLYSFGLTLNTDFFATKNLPSLGSIPANIAGAPSHFTVMLIDEREEPDNISLSDCRKLIAALPPATPLLIISSSRCSKCKFLPAWSSCNSSENVFIFLCRYILLQVQLETDLTFFYQHGQVCLNV